MEKDLSKNKEKDIEALRSDHRKYVRRKIGRSVA